MNSDTETNSESDSELDSTSSVSASQVTSQSTTNSTVPTNSQSSILEQYFTCGICSDILCNPYTLCCQHTFCKACLLETQKSFGSREQCPTCNLSYILHPENHNYLLTNYIDSLLTDDYKLKRNREKLKASLEAEVREELSAELFKTLYEQELLNAKLKVEQTNLGYGQPKYQPYPVTFGVKSKPIIEKIIDILHPILMGSLVVCLIGGSYKIFTGKHLFA